MNISYKTKVKLVKISLIIIIFSIILIFIVTPMIYIKIRSNGYTFAYKMLRSFLKKEAVPPVLSGTIKNGGAYYLSAETVTNNLISSNYKEIPIVRVTKPYLLYNTNKNGLVFSVTSNEGVIDTKEQLINIPGIVSITSNQGFKATLYDILINFKYSTLESYKPFTAFYDNKKLTASGIVMNQNDNIIKLKGPVLIQTTN